MLSVSENRSVPFITPFQKIGNKYWSVRAGLNYRALGVEVEVGISWFWIGITIIASLPTK